MVEYVCERVTYNKKRKRSFGKACEIDSIERDITLVEAESE